ncbi:M14 family metallopeptidase [Pseudomonadales bacterium]|nr:M14 family metallopeptidase [Pseudomonadales bacterium]MDB9868804.1 M14 family metallopeptidase [Pseudomonadales bacterium]MDB9918310.1 M14 family metallopeptidase [Pseudomonadales bacterium]MDC1307940.1 M14 family metallopeptidase [Pseudomonadales bacterium]
MHHDYSQTRKKFLGAASAAGGVVETHLDPNATGPEGVAISTDAAVFGDPTLPAF